jgi:lipid-A-disaccharide synthase
MSSGPKIFLVAAEESGDRLGAALIQALRQQTGGEAQFAGVGGNAMAAQGVNSLFDIHELAIIGFTAIPQRLPVIVRRIRETAAAVIAEKPDVLVIIDSPDFTHRVAKRVRAAAPSIPIVDYVSPSVWAWRPWRARSMRRYVDHVMALLPFEPAAHRELGGPACTYVGHPLAEQIEHLRPNAEEAQRRLSDPPVLLVLPGSRGSEIRRLSADFGAAIARVREQVGAIELVLPTVDHLAGPVAEATSGWAVRPRIVVDPAEKQSAFRIARAALAKSGTVTLELALAGVPMVAAYKVPKIEAFFVRPLIRVPTYILANLVIREKVVPEFVQEDCNPETLSSALVPLIGDTPERRRQIDAFARLDAIMEIKGRAPAARAAEIVLAAVRPRLNVTAQ